MFAPAVKQGHCGLICVIIFKSELVIFAVGDTFELKVLSNVPLMCSLNGSAYPNICVYIILKSSADTALMKIPLMIISILAVGSVP